MLASCLQGKHAGGESCRVRLDAPIGFTVDSRWVKTHPTKMDSRLRENDFARRHKNERPLMPTFEEQVNMDRDQQFADWGKPAVYRRVTAKFIPELQHAVETHEDIPVTIILNSQPSSLEPVSSIGHRVNSATIWMKSEEMPVGSPAETDRVVIDDIEYEVHETNQIGPVTSLTCQQCE